MNRFWSKLNRNGPVPQYRPELGPCWLWTAYKTRWGYGSFRMGKEMRPAHRVSYELAVAQIPAGMEIDHLCRVRACCNPAHLEAVSRLENQRRGMKAKQTHCINGHPYDEVNTYKRPSKSAGQRDCRACIRDRVRRYLQKRIAA